MLPGGERVFETLPGGKQGRHDQQTNPRVPHLTFRDPVCHGIRIEFNNLIAAERQGDMEPAPHVPASMRRHRARIMAVAAEGRLESEKAAIQDDRVLQRTVALFTGMGPALVRDAAGRPQAGHPRVKQPPETLTGRVEARRVIQATDDGQQLVQCEFHESPSGRISARLVPVAAHSLAAAATGNRASTGSPVGASPPVVCSAVTSAP